MLLFILVFKLHEHSFYSILSGHATLNSATELQIVHIYPWIDYTNDLTYMW